MPSARRTTSTHHLTAVNRTILVFRPPSGLVPITMHGGASRSSASSRRYRDFPLRQCHIGLGCRSIARLIPRSPKSRLHELVP